MAIKGSSPSLRPLGLDFTCVVQAALTKTAQPELNLICFPFHSWQTQI